MDQKHFLLGMLLVSSAITHAQPRYARDRVYTANQVSNTVSVVDPSTNTVLGEIDLGKPYPNVLSPLYRGQALVHGLRYLPTKKLLAVVSIGSNAVTFVSTETNKVIKTVYVGRSPHEPTFTPDGKQVWVSVRGEAYISVIDVATLTEVKQVPVADGPGMVSFSPDGKLAYVCSSFTPELDIINTATYKPVKKIPVVSPFSPNIFTSPKGEWVAFTHKDVGKVTVLNTSTQTIANVLNTGAITNHVTFTYLGKKLLMLVTVGGENKVRVFDPAQNFKQTDSLNVGTLPHGIWAAPDGKLAYVGLEYADEVQGINLETMQPLPPVKIGQSPQALVYAENAVNDARNRANLTSLTDSSATQLFMLKPAGNNFHGLGRLAVRPVGLADLVEQIFSNLQPNGSYTLALTHSQTAPYTADYEINRFMTDDKGKYMGQSTGLVHSTEKKASSNPYTHIVLVDNKTREVVLID
ncbi:YncE family protein [Spirosoma fluviale]|uniref:40-residue YVTN family beta-propeller repeat-containing protein n=1 Tax=Spirosoma fluviale TaxID=1597977 RepID=A0A286GN51_9BACT|nr:YncE family protein [Spirosoma fluviale]SOD96940.1 40-residue YVTN family beta-propeller repeat-containing protein [Spirosoma fluviale]